MIELNDDTKKSHSSRLHAQRRAYERYGMDLSIPDIRRIELYIRRGYNSFHLERRSTYRSIWLVKYENMNMVVVYNNRHKCLSTCLPKHVGKIYFND